MKGFSLDPSTLAVDRARLLELLIAKSYAKRAVVLASGRQSDFYIDCKKTALTAEGHWLVGRLLYEAIRTTVPNCRGVGGLTMGADPLASAVSLVSHFGPQPLDAFLVRKEPKGHGTGQWVEGLAAFSPKAEVAVVEDVVTTGASAIKAVERARIEGLEPRAVFALVDRQEGGREAIEAAGVTVHSLFTRGDFPS